MADELVPRRHQLHSVLKSITENVYFSPRTSPNFTMQYPCIVYKRDSEEKLYADNKPHRRTQRYQVTVIDEDPDSAIPEKVGALPLCSFAQNYTADNLNHDVFNLFF